MIIVCLAMVSAIMLSAGGDVRECLSDYTAAVSIDSKSLLIVLISSLIILLTLKRFSVNASAVYAVLGALEAWRITSGHVPQYSMILSFVAAPIVAFVLAAVLRWLFKIFLGRTHIHLITLSY